VRRVPHESWFDECRYGMFVHANIATVPAFAPLHEYADWYWAFMEHKPDVVVHPTCPLPEVVTWHEQHYGDQPFDAFLPRLTFTHFDADWYADLLDAAGMRYLVHVTKHHDGFCWWDTAFTERNAGKVGPGRDIVRELADATRARGHVFGTYYSLLDWGHPDYPDQAAYVDAFMIPQIRELVERYQPALLWGDGHWGHSGDHWRADDVLDEMRTIASREGFELLANDRFFASTPDFTTYEYDVPATPPSGRWELCRGIGYSFCVNQIERDEDHLSAREIVAMLVETVAKGGNFLLNIGPNADGTLPAVQERVLRESGSWVRAHADAIHGSRSFTVAGEGAHWYTTAKGVVNAFDLSAAPEPRFAALTGSVRAVTTPDGAALAFRVGDDGLSVDARAIDRHPFGARYCVDLVPTERIAVPARAPFSIGAALAAAAGGDVVEVPPGRYTSATEQFPLVVPAGVTLRGGPGDVVIDSGSVVAVQLQAGSRLQRLHVRGGAPGYMFIPPTCVVGSGDAIEIDECRVTSISLRGGAGHLVTRNVVISGKIWCKGANNVTVRGNFQSGLRWGVGIELDGGANHVVTENECYDSMCAIRLISTADTEVTRNRYRTRWFGIHLLNAERTRLYRNRAERTMRAVGIEGGNDVVVEKQHAERCDSGVIVERGATNVRIHDNCFHDCRLGVLVWEAAPAEVTDTARS
jgi:alpha-L-fucosidase